jgi:hypothetical protein
MDNEIFSKDDLKLYQSLGFKVKGEVKKSFLAVFVDRQSRKTAQRLFNNPSLASPIQQKIMKNCLLEVVNSQKKAISIELEKAAIRIRQQKKQLETFETYLSNLFLISKS